MDRHKPQQRPFILQCAHAHRALVSLTSLAYDMPFCVSVCVTVYKVETIGDAYLACSGVVEERDDHTKLLVTCALDFQSASNYFRTPDNRPLSVRTGIHTGHVVAGVVGRKMPRYHLFGETVTVAEEMEQTAVAGAVVISAATYQHVSDLFACHRLSDLTLQSGATTGRWKVLFYRGGYGVVGANGGLRDEQEGGLPSRTLTNVVTDILSKVHEVNVLQQVERERRWLGTAQPSRLAVHIPTHYTNGREPVLSAVAADDTPTAEALSGRRRSYSCDSEAAPSHVSPSAPSTGDGANPSQPVK